MQIESHNAVLTTSGPDGKQTMSTIPRNTIITIHPDHKHHEKVVKFVMELLEQERQEKAQQ